MEVFTFEENFKFSSLATVEFFAQVIVQSLTCKDLNIMSLSLEFLRCFEHISVLRKRGIAFSGANARFTVVSRSIFSTILSHACILSDESNTFLQLFGRRNALL